MNQVCQEYLINSDQVINQFYKLLEKNSEKVDFENDILVLSHSEYDKNIYANYSKALIYDDKYLVALGKDYYGTHLQFIKSDKKSEKEIIRVLESFNYKDSWNNQFKYNVIMCSYDNECISFSPQAPGRSYYEEQHCSYPLHNLIPRPNVSIIVESFKHNMSYPGPVMFLKENTIRRTNAEVKYSSKILEFLEKRLLYTLKYI